MQLLAGETARSVRFPWDRSAPRVGATERAALLLVGFLGSGMDGGGIEM